MSVLIFLIVLYILLGKSMMKLFEKSRITRLESAGTRFSCCGMVQINRQKASIRALVAVSNCQHFHLFRDGD
ncbi:MAG: hypothetical protein R2778_03700 [Saprospiraceae bacterium]